MGSTAIERLRANWFWPLAVLLVGVVWVLTHFSGMATPDGWENVVLIDVLVTLPTLFWLCYRKALPIKQLIVRVVALQCLGIWFASELVPLDHQDILPSLSWLRCTGVAVLIAIEVRIMVGMFRIVFKNETTTDDLKNVGMPSFLAKLALMEARFWRWVFSAFRK